MLFGKETNRVIREKWASLEAFAQELWSIFQGDLPVYQNAPVVLTQKGDSPPLQIVQPEGSTIPPITFTRGGVTTAIGDTTIGAGGGVDLGSLTFPNPTPDIIVATPAAADTPFVLYGELVAQVTGNTYQVRVWGKPPLDNPAMATLNVRFPMIDPADVIAPPFVPALVLCFPGTVAGTRTIVDAVAIAPVFLPRA